MGALEICLAWGVQQYKTTNIRRDGSGTFAEGARLALLESRIAQQRVPRTPGFDTIRDGGIRPLHWWADDMLIVNITSSYVHLCILYMYVYVYIYIYICIHTHTIC